MGVNEKVNWQKCNHIFLAEFSECQLNFPVSCSVDFHDIGMIRPRVSFAYHIFIFSILKNSQVYFVLLLSSIINRTEQKYLTGDCISNANLIENW